MVARNGMLVALAAGGSLLLHVLLFSAFRVVRPGAPGPDAAGFGEMTVSFEPPSPLRLPETPVAEYEIGEDGAKGYASHQVPGRQEAVSRQANSDQAALSLDPSGTDLVVETPGDVGRQGEAGRPAVAMSATAAAARQAVSDLAANVRVWWTDRANAVTPPQAPQPEPVAANKAAEADLPVPDEGTPAQAQGSVPMTHATTGALSRPAPAPPQVSEGRSGQADPAPKSDSESDPFSALGSAQFRDGRLSVRFGRKVRSRRPKIGLAGMVDLYERRPAHVVLKVATDAAGKVTAVDVVRSSGSNEIDQPCRVAMYDWWFEPKKGPGGAPAPDSFQFTISFP